MRYCLPNARIMIHQPSGGFQGQATDAQIHLNEMLNFQGEKTEAERVK